MAIDFKSIGTILFSGFVSTTGNEAIDALLTRGGIESMFFTISLVLLALSMGGLLFTLGIFQQLINSIEKWLSSVTSVITAAALTAVGVNVIIGEQYLAILLTGESFEACFEKVGLARKTWPGFWKMQGQLLTHLFHGVFVVYLFPVFLRLVFLNIYHLRYFVYFHQYLQS